jgi:hypothetical protein
MQEKQTDDRKYSLIPLSWGIHSRRKRCRVIMNARVNQYASHSRTITPTGQEMIDPARLNIYACNFSIIVRSKDCELDGATPAVGLQDLRYVLRGRVPCVGGYQRGGEKEERRGTQGWLRYTEWGLFVYPQLQLCTATFRFMFLMDAHRKTHVSASAMPWLYLAQRREQRKRKGRSCHLGRPAIGNDERQFTPPQ